MTSTDQPAPLTGSPNAFGAAVKHLATLSDLEFASLLRQVDEPSTPTPSRSDLAKAVAEATPLSRKQARDTINAASALVAALMERPPGGDDPHGRLAREVVLEEGDGAVDVELVTSRLTQLMKCDSIWMAAKANRLQFRHSNLFRKSEIISDLRPIFGGPDNEDPEAFLIWHTLRIRHFDGMLSDSDQSIEFALDGLDLEQLQQEIERAIKKHKALRAKLADLSAVHFPMGDLREEKND